MLRYIQQFYLILKVVKIWYRLLKNKVMQRAGLSDRELASPISHVSISEPCTADHWRFSFADSTALLAAAAAAPRSFFTNSSNCQKQKSKQNYYNKMVKSMNRHKVIWYMLQLYITINQVSSATIFSNFGYLKLLHITIISNDIPKMGHLLHSWQEIRRSICVLGPLNSYRWRC